MNSFLPKQNATRLDQSSNGEAFLQHGLLAGSASIDKFSLLGAIILIDSEGLSKQTGLQRFRDL